MFQNIKKVVVFNIFLGSIIGICPVYAMDPQDGEIELERTKEKKNAFVQNKHLAYALYEEEQRKARNENARRMAELSRQSKELSEVCKTESSFYASFLEKEKSQ